MKLFIENVAQYCDFYEVWPFLGNGHDIGYAQLVHKHSSSYSKDNS